jgi:hypothetical protein
MKFNNPINATLHILLILHLTIISTDRKYLQDPTFGSGYSYYTSGE